MRNNRTINILAGGVTSASLLWLYFLFHPVPPDVDWALHRAIGERLASEALKSMQPQSRLIVLARARAPYKAPAAEAQLEGLLKTLHEQRKNVYALRSFSPDPLRLLSVPPGDFFDLIRQAREDDVIVSFLGPPLLSDAQVAKLAGKHPPILALCSGSMPMQVNLQKVFTQKLLAVAVVSRPDAPAQPGPGSDQQIFDRMFMLITPANTSDLPGVANN